MAAPAIQTELTARDMSILMMVFQYGLDEFEERKDLLNKASDFARDVATVVAYPDTASDDFVRIIANEVRPQLLQRQLSA